MAGTTKRVTARFRSKSEYVKWVTESKGLNTSAAGEEWVGMLQNDLGPRDNGGHKGCSHLLVRLHGEVEMYHDMSQANVVRAGKLAMW